MGDKGNRLPLTAADRKRYEAEIVDARERRQAAEDALDEAESDLQEYESALEEGLETQAEADFREARERRKLESRMAEIRTKGW